MQFHTTVTDITVDQASISLLPNGRLFRANRLSLIDTEIDDIEARESAIRDVLKNLKSEHTLRFWLKSYATGVTKLEDSRRASLEEQWFVRNDLFVILEMAEPSHKELFKKLKSKESRSLNARAQEFVSSFDMKSFESAGFQVKSLASDELKILFHEPIANPPVKIACGIDLGHKLLGVVRLIRQTPTAIPLTLLSELKDSLPLPYEIRVSVTKLPKAKSESHLRRRIGQKNSSSGQVNDSVLADTESHLEEITLGGSELFQIEFLVLLERDTEKELRAAASDVVQTLKPLGDFVFETVGAVPSLLASEIGSPQHLTLLETDSAISAYLPLLSRGKAEAFNHVGERGTLTLHRRDQTLESVDLFNQKYDNYSTCIFGKSGRGKSVFTNLLTRALLTDPNVMITKVDVGGSHSKETAALMGIEHRFSVSQASGLSVFDSLNCEPEKRSDVCSVISTFLGSLLLEEGEVFLSKSMKGAIEEEVKRYAGIQPLNPSIDLFYEFAHNLPRRELLKRWCTGGIYENAFKSQVPKSRLSPQEVRSNSGRSASTDINGSVAAADSHLPRLVYYNFAEIFQASDPDYGQGVMAAIVAQFNLDLMKHKSRRLVFIVDEAPFFIERCFSFFKFSTANVRKFGGSFIVIAQKSTDVIITGDTGILDNTGSKVLFSVDGERDDFAKRLKLSDDEMERLESLRSEKGAYSEMMCQDAFGSRVLRIQLSRGEYWSFTSSQDDNRKIEALLSAVPGLSQEQAIGVLAGV